MGEKGLTPQHQVVIVGAGQAGIAAALALKDAGVASVVLERTDHVASAWRSRYDGLRLNTWRRLSQLPGRPYAKGTPTFPSRDQLVEYVEGHAREDGIDIRLGTRVERIDQADGDWIARTSEGEFRAPQLIVAMGLDQSPYIPDWPGRDGFEGTLLHSAQYRNAEPFKDRRVLVVGPGSSGFEIANELAEGGADRVWLAIRTPPNILLRQGPGPVPGDLIGTWLWHLPTGLADRLARFGRRMDVGDLTEYGLPLPDRGVFEDVRERGKVPAIVDKQAIEAIKDGRIEVVSAVDSLDATGVRLSDGTRIDPESVVCTTGYRRELEPLVGHLGVLGQRGMPSVIGPDPAAEGLRFIGYVVRPGGLGYMGKQARRAAKAIRRELGQRRSGKEDEPWRPRSEAPRRRSPDGLKRT